MTIIDQKQTAPCSIEFERECVHFLNREAELLDNNRFQEWLDTCLSPDLQYTIPIRTTRENHSGISEFSTTGFHMKDNIVTMTLRVSRLATEHAWAEDPASRTRRMVSNIRVSDLSTDEAEVKSYLMLYRSQGDTTNYDLIVGEREDILSRENGAWRLRKRNVLLNHTVLGTPNLGVFI